MVRALSENDCRTAISEGDFAADVRAARPLTAIILSQSWCPQWFFMKRYLPSVEAAAGVEIAVFYFEYDLSPIFADFMAYKEETLKNREVPYVRFYLDGALTSESNYISAQSFLARLGIQRTATEIYNSLPTP
jgi:hypothetical protein